MSIDKGVNPAGDDTGWASRITFRLDPASGVPTYLQLVHQVEQALRLGYLVRGDQLPRVKDVVGTLAINPNTVLKAYRELEHEGLVAARPGIGTFLVGWSEWRLGNTSIVYPSNCMNSPPLHGTSLASGRP